MSWASKTHTFSPSTVAQSSQVNDNFDDMVDQLNIAMPSAASGHGIIMFSGAVADIPSGWYLCNGSNSTPDLRGKFVLGAGGSYNPGDTGGAATHTLTVDEIPSHTHSISGSSDDDSGDTPKGTSPTPSNTMTTAATGGGQAHNNMPPYHALAFIMKS